MFQRHKLEIHQLHPWPNHPVLCQGCAICALQFIRGARTLHDCHTAQEDEHVRGRKNTLVHKDAGDDCEVLVSKSDFLLEEFVPDCRRGAEDGYERS